MKPNLFRVLLLLIMTALQAQGLQSSPLSMDISNLHVQDIVQDSTGYIWMGTARGLNRIDAYKKPVYYFHSASPTSLNDDNVHLLEVTGNGDLLMVTRRGLSYMDRKTGIFYSLNDSTAIRDISCMTTGKDGTIYVGSRTRHYLSRVDVANKRLIDIGLETVKRGIGHMCCDDSGKLWLCTARGVEVFDPEKDCIVGHMDNVERIYRSMLAGTLYAKMANRIVLIDSRTRKVTRTIMTLDSPIIAMDVTARHQLYFLDSKMDLYRYQARKQTFSKRNIAEQVGKGCVTSVLVDRSQNIWVGTFEKGYVFIPREGRMFNSDWDIGSKFENHFVTYMTGDGKGRYWISTRHDGLYEYQRATDKLTLLLNIPQKGEETALACCLHDSQGRLWTLAWENVYCYDTSNGNTSLKTIYDNVKQSRYVMEDRQGNIWIAANGHGGIWELPKGGSAFRRAFPRLLPDDANVTFIMQTKAGEYLFSYYGKGVFFADARGHIRPLLKEVAPDMKSFMEQVIYIFEDSQGYIWIGSYGNGLLRYDPQTKKSTRYTMEHGLPSNDILSIAEDAESHALWVSTSYGLSRLEGTTFLNFFTRDTQYGNQYHERAVYAENGCLYFMGNHGITSFYPQRIENRKCNIPLVIESLTTSKNVYQSLPADAALQLSYRETSFNVTFVGFEFVQAGSLQYSYKLEGYDEDWSTPSTDRTARYKDLPPGQYKLKVRVADNTGCWSSHQAEMDITIRSAPWNTWWAILLYIAIAAWIGNLLLRFYVKLQLSQEKIKMSEKMLAHEQELNQSKITFFENISHELKTPLGLIYGPYCELAKQQHLSPRAMECLSLIGSNVERLKKLVEEILYFSHHDSEKLHLKLARRDIVDITQRILQHFSFLYATKQMKVDFIHDAHQLLMPLDLDKLGAILQNLLSNAFKYTPQGGKVNVRLSVQTAADIATRFGQQPKDSPDYAVIEVADNGMGISPEEEEKVFDRFYRGQNTTHVGGSGIGLYYTRCLVEKHKGLIKAERNQDGGFTGVFCLPISEKAYSKEDFMETDDTKPLEMPLQYRIEEKPDNTQDNVDKPTLLVVEDEPGVQQFLSGLLGSNYNIIEVFDGEEGWKKTIELIPDIIIMDVMMPKMNGMELCEKIKDDDRTCHIPVVMLSAKSNVDEYIEGMDSGADMYVGKPFNPDYLKALLRGLLANRRRVRHIIARKKTDEEKDDVLAHLKDNDKKMLEKLDMILEKQMSNSDLSMEELASDLNFSISTFYRKIKGLTGLSPNEYVRLYRLRTAAKLIVKGDYSMSEVAFKTGFGTLSYFSSIFKKQYGMTPSEYKSKQMGG